MIEQEGSMLNSHSPQGWVGDVWPMNGGVKHHCPCNGHDTLDAPFSPSIVVMSSNSSEADDLLEEAQLLGETLRCVRQSIVRKVSLRDDSVIAAHGFEPILC